MFPVSSRLHVSEKTITTGCISSYHVVQTTKLLISKSKFGKFKYHLLIGECNYRMKAVGMKELEELKFNGQFIPAKGKEIYYLLASRNGFTEELLSLRDDHVVLIYGIQDVVSTRSNG